LLRDRVQGDVNKRQDSDLAVIRENIIEFREEYRRDDGERNELLRLAVPCLQDVEDVSNTSLYMGRVLCESYAKNRYVIPNVTLERYRHHLKCVSETATSLFIMKQGLPGEYIEESQSEGATALFDYFGELQKSNAQIIRLFIVAEHQIDEMHQQLADPQLLQSYFAMCGPSVHNYWTTRADIRSNGNVRFDGVLVDEKMQLAWDQNREQMDVMIADRHSIEPTSSMFSEIQLQLFRDIASQKFRVIQLSGSELSA